MIPCDTVQSRLLMQVDLSRLPAEYRCHVHDCPACRRVVEQLCRLEQLLPQLPVPPSTPQVKSTLIARVIAEAPVPSSRLAALRRLETFEQWLAKTGWKFSAGIAAALLLGFGVWWFHSAQPPATASAPYHRHSLLHAEVQHVSALATADTPAERLRIWTEIVRELNAETALVYSIAPEAEMRSLGQMFDRAVHEGIVRQTAQFPEQFPPQQRQQLLREVAKQLRDISEESERLSAQAPPQSRPVLLQMATTARIGCTHVEALQP